MTRGSAQPRARHHVGTLAGFKSERVAGFRLECMAGFVGIRRHGAIFQYHYVFIGQALRFLQG
jgi:hypothetical protein